jgi:endonuclease/exonuclease/phosphatase family metal-dependent hydrolase
MADLGWGKGGAPPSMPEETIAMDDFNSEPEDDEYMQIVGKIDPFSGRVGHFHWLCR